MRDKQIEELTRIICQSNKGGKCGYDGKPCDCDCGSYQLATKVYNAGYRKASDVALETVDSFQRILRHIFLNMCDGNDYERLNLLQIDGAIEALYDSFIAELKKKYESEGEG